MGFSITLGNNSTCTRDFVEDGIMCYCADAYLYIIPKLNIPAFDILLGLASFIFVGFLLSKAKTTMKQLKESESITMTTYYVFLWVVCIFNVLRFVVVSLVAEPKPVYEILFLVMNALLLFLELSVVIFMSHGYMVPGNEAIFRTSWISGLIALGFLGRYKGSAAFGLSSVNLGFILFWLGIESAVMFIGKVSLFEQQDWQASLFWFVLSAILSIGYGTILLLPRTRFRDRLPARPLFYIYSRFMLILQVIRAVGCLLNIFSFFFGFCFLMVWLLLYYAFYAPLLYWGFLKDFLRHTVFSEYYSDMVVNGYLDSDI